MAFIDTMLSKIPPQKCDTQHKWHPTKMASHKNDLSQKWHISTWIIGFLKYYQQPDRELTLQSETHDETGKQTGKTQL